MADPIFWLTTTEDPERERRTIRAVAGRKPIVEKLPQIGHVGDYDNKQRAKGTRFVFMIRHEGHEIPMCLTNAAAHLDPSTGYGNYMRGKARALGWYPSGACPSRLFRMGELTLDQLASEEARTGTPCEPQMSNRKRPCPHDVAERAARTSTWNEEQKERLASFKSDADRVIEETRKATQELMAGLQGQQLDGFERILAMLTKHQQVVDALPDKPGKRG